jgi:hypothetical protein
MNFKKILQLLILIPVGIAFALLSEIIKNGHYDCRYTDFLRLPCADPQILIMRDILVGLAIASFALLIVLPVLFVWRKREDEHLIFNSIK